MKSVLITGAASGIGKVAAALFAKEEFNVVISDIQKAEGKETTDEIKAVLEGKTVNNPGLQPGG